MGRKGGLSRDSAAVAILRRGCLGRGRGNFDLGRLLFALPPALQPFGPRPLSPFPFLTPDLCWHLDWARLDLYPLTSPLLQRPSPALTTPRLELVFSEVTSPRTCSGPLPLQIPPGPFLGPHSLCSLSRPRPLRGSGPHNDFPGLPSTPSAAPAPGPPWRPPPRLWPREEPAPEGSPGPLGPGAGGAGGRQTAPEAPQKPFQERFEVDSLLFRRALPHPRRASVWAGGTVDGRLSADSPPGHPLGEDCGCGSGERVHSSRRDVLSNQHGQASRGGLWVPGGAALWGPGLWP
ncbi:UPF0692 protein C19orf54 homolog isoform X2 [Vombatus ursinus]|uniref:UPF0692 protein C19orf54 homolog isoform X2 n=1 Tax=Vombatus ursinus TaxID=29139 RepID=UPI000FFD5A31|nr:UPF0692 protein C19orf54 homolog isoform X2 [Vombatus ursinus]